MILKPSTLLVVDVTMNESNSEYNRLERHFELEDWRLFKIRTVGRSVGGRTPTYLYRYR
jgi:hypothetical protein